MTAKISTVEAGDHQTADPPKGSCSFEGDPDAFMEAPPRPDVNPDSRSWTRPLNAASSS